MEETIQPQMGLTFERVWAAIQRIAEQTAEQHKELAEQHKELTEQHKELTEQHKETERAVKELAEQHKETERFLKENGAETDRRMKETDRRMKELQKSMGKLGNRFGELVEHLVSPNLIEKFKALGYAFSRTNTRVKYEDVNTGEIIAEVDVLLENGDSALVVEIKADPSIEDVKDHVKRMKTLRDYADAHNDKRYYLGAIAGGIVRDSVKDYALKNGFYALEQSGDTMSVAATPELWKPKRW
ncbi:MAG: hypothetical protein LBG43_02695 [Treponema sp.]|jgi:hypothetical protein|nr:hypothetical protein [Treponema sp.]